MHSTWLWDQACFGWPGAEKDVQWPRSWNSVGSHRKIWESLQLLSRKWSATRIRQRTLFPFSLDGKAARWLASLPTGTLTTWEQVRAAFLSHFYTKSKTAALRHKISNFKQKSDGPFYDAWERYKEYRRECPHHGFEDDYILDVFYDRVSYEFRNALDS